MLGQNKCDIRDQHGLEHISHRLIVRIDDFCIFTPRTIHPSVGGLFERLSVQLFAWMEIRSKSI